ncbi:hypothetical protein B7463_g11898, partial [Scytalidium lignicola]
MDPQRGSQQAAIPAQTSLSVPHTLRLSDSCSPNPFLSSTTGPAAPPQTPLLVPHTPQFSDTLSPSSLLSSTKKAKKQILVDNILRQLIDPASLVDPESTIKAIQDQLFNAALPPIPTLAPSSLVYEDEALELFSLRAGEPGLFDEIKPISTPQYLIDNLQRISCVTSPRRCKQSEEFSRMIIDQILVSALYEENEAQGHGKGKGQSNADDPDEPAKLQLVHEMPILKEVLHEGEKKMLSGYVDYTIWYDIRDKKSLATNLVIVEAKRAPLSLSAMAQLAAYMGVIHTTRKEKGKQNCLVYGLLSDGKNFVFSRINNDGVFRSSQVLDWMHPVQRDKIYTIMRFLLRAAALSSPSTSPIKDAGKRKVMVESFSSPARAELFDYGCGCSSFDDDDDVNQMEQMDEAE